jgi:hypothetical protein
MGLSFYVSFIVTNAGPAFWTEWAGPIYCETFGALNTEHAFHNILFDAAAINRR